MVDVLEKKKLNCKNYHFQELCFSKVSNVRSISESFGKPHLSLILTNQGLTIRPKENYVLFPITCPKFLGSVGRQTFFFIKTFSYGKSMKSLKNSLKIDFNIPKVFKKV